MQQAQVGTQERSIWEDVYKRQVLVDHLVHVIAKAVFCGVDAAEGQTTIEKIGEPQVEVDGMGRARLQPKAITPGRPSQPLRSLTIYWILGTTSSTM